MGGGDSLLYKVGKLPHYATLTLLPRATTQNTTTSHSNQHELLPPSPPVALSSIARAMAISAIAQDLGTTDPYGSVIGVGHPVCS